MSASDVQTPAALPSELSYNLPSSLPAGWRCQQLRQPTISNLPASGVVSGNEFQIQIPQLPNSFLDLSTAYINMRCSFAFTPGAAKASDSAVASDAPRILGSGWSLFQRYELYFNNSNLLDQIQFPGVAQNALNNMILTTGQKSALNYQGLSSTDPSPSVGTILHPSDGIRAPLTYVSGTAITGIPVDFSIPMTGAWSACDKLMPMFLGGFRIDLTADDVANYLIPGAVAATGLNIVIHSLEFVSNVITVDPGSLAAVISQHPDKMFIRTQTFTHSSQILAAQCGAGLYELMVSSLVSSMKS